MTPLLVAIVLVTGLLALLPTRRLAARTTDRWVVAGYYLALWAVLLGIALVPSLRRLATPVLLVLAVAPWISIRGLLRRVIGERRRRAEPRNITPPEAGGPWPP